MVNFIHRTNILRFETGNPPSHSAPRSAREQLEKTLAEKIAHLLTQIPPRELSRGLRDFMLLYFLDLKEIPAGFQKQMLDLMVLFEDLDRLEEEAGS